MQIMSSNAPEGTTAESLGLTEGRPLPSGFTLYRQVKGDDQEIPQGLLEVAYRATAEGFGRPNDDHNRHDVDTHITPDFVDLDWIADERGEVVGFGATATFREEGKPTVFYLGGLMFVPEAQGRGAGTQYIEKRMEEEDAHALALQTQSKYMLKAALRLGTPNTELSLQFATQNRNFPNDGSNHIEGIEGTQLGDLVVERKRYQVGTEENRVPTSLYGDPEQRAKLWIDPRLDEGDAVTMVVERANDL